MVRIAFILAALAVLIGWLGHATDIDIILADAAFDRAAQQFPWRHSWLAETFNHGILKNILVAAGLCVTGLAAVDVLRPLDFLGVSERVRLRIVAISAMAVPLATSLLKQLSSSHCPWDLIRYGGSEPYIRLLDAMPGGVPAGHCMPGGHASSALWLVSIAVFWLPGRPDRAAIAAGTALTAGFVTGWLQQLRGAHFLTHTLWSMWVAAVVVVVVLGIAQNGLTGKPKAGKI